MAQTPDTAIHPWRNCMLVGCCVLIVSVLVLTVPFLAARHYVFKQVCYLNLTQIRLALQHYVTEYQPSGYLPPLSPEPGRLMFDLTSLIPEGDTKPAVNVFGGMHCPHDNNHRRAQRKGHQLSTEAEVDDHSYFYLGYAITDDASMLAFAAAYRAQLKTGAPFSDNLQVASGQGTFGTDNFFRLHKDLPQMLVGSGATIPGSPFENPKHAEAHAISNIPVLIERIELPEFTEREGVSNHTVTAIDRRYAGLVVYLDGSARFLAYPGEWPMTETTMRALLELDALGGAE